MGAIIGLLVSARRRRPAQAQGVEAGSNVCRVGTKAPPRTPTTYNRARGPVAAARTSKKRLHKKRPGYFSRAAPKRGPAESAASARRLRGVGATPPRRRRDRSADATPPRRRRDRSADATPPRRRRDRSADATPPRRRRDRSAASRQPLARRRANMTPSEKIGGPGANVPT